VTRMRGACFAVVAAVLAVGAGQGAAEILSASFDPAGESLDLTAAGAKDWAVFGRGAGAQGPSTLAAADFKKGGAGIAKTIQASGLTDAFGGDGLEDTMWTGVSWMWADGTRRASVVHRNGDASGSGLRLEIGKGGFVAFEFAGPGAGATHVACLALRRDGPLEIVARQGLDEKSIDTSAGKSVGLAIVKFTGDDPLVLSVRSPGGRAIMRGFAATLCGPADLKGAVPGVPTPQDIAMKQVEKLGPIDPLQIARDFGDCILRYGRDRYGKVHSPLFSNILTREREPRLTPYPLFAELSQKARDANAKQRQEREARGEHVTPFMRFDFNKILNYPPGLGAEGPHKVTLYGCDPYEDRDLYDALFELTRVTGEPKYRQEAEKALVWWFTNTQGPAGLYPWGEHLGWDLEHDCPTYFDGPSKHLYAACYHEIKDTVPFLDILARIPAAKPGEPTPLERYALGIWNAHFWDKEKAYFCRHGDYTGKDDRKGSDAGFPAHLGAYLRVWAAAYLNTKRPEFRKQMDGILRTVLDMAVSRSERYGFFPFTFAPELQGKPPGDKAAPGQSIRLARHAAELSVDLEAANPAVAAKLRRLAALHLGQDGCEEAVRAARAARKPGGAARAQGAGPRPEAKVRDLSKPGAAPNDHANEILRHVELYRAYGDKAYLDVATTYARLAYVIFCDATCPLPRATASSAPIRTTQGEPFPDFYFRGARLMKAYALLGEATQQAR